MITKRRIAVVCAAALAVATAQSSIDAAPQRPDPLGHRTIVLGRSVDGRAITAVETGDSDNPTKTLVVGCIHGNECAGIAVAARLARTPPTNETDLWILPNLNPDGAAAGTRGNAHGIDLNRNFPWRWTRLAGAYDSGSRALSEPETRVAYRLIARVRPAISIWFHQHLDLVDDSSGSLAVERRFATAAGLRLAALTQEPGSAVTWESHCFPNGSPFVVELPAGALAPAAVSRFARAVRVAADSPSARRPVGVCSVIR
jgi:protein MpaA